MKGEIWNPLLVYLKLTIDVMLMQGLDNTNGCSDHNLKCIF